MRDPAGLGIKTGFAVLYRTMTAPIAPTRSTSLPNPYVGPRPFERGQRLYGRDREVVRLRDLLIAERIVLLCSPSGAGKTSLVRASLVPALEQEGFQVLPEIRVGTEAGTEAGTQAGTDLRPNRYATSMLLSLEKDLPQGRQRGPDELVSAGLRDCLERYGRHGDGTVLIFDQFEELLVTDATDQDVKAAFLAELGSVLRDRGLWALFAIREELVAGLDPYLALLPTRLRTRFRLDLLGEAAARMAVQGPARDARVEFCDAAARRLVDNLRQVRVRRPEGLVDALGPYVEPVQLQVVCERLWDRPRADAARIAESDIAEVGDVDSALAGYYAAKVGAVARVTGVDERAIRTWFDRALVTEQGLRAQVLTGPLNSAGDEQVLRLLEDACLLRAETRGGARWFELAHDRLVGPARASNAEWREAHLQPFQRHAALWQDVHRPDDLLLTGGALTAADRWAGEHPDQLEPAEREFLAASHHEQGTRRRVRLLAITASFLAIVAVLALIAIAIKDVLADSRLLGLQAMLQLEQDPAAALVTAVRALGRVSTPEAAQGLSSALAQSHERAVVREPAGSVDSVELSPDGQLLVTIANDQTARTWSATTGALRAELGAGVFSARFSPDGSQMVVTARGDRTAQVRDAATGAVRRVLTGHSGVVVSAGWSPDGSRIVTASGDGTARIWDAATGLEEAVLTGHEVLVSSAGWSHDGAWVVTAGSDGTARVWDAATGRLRARLDLQLLGGGKRVASATFSPDGTRVAVAQEGEVATANAVYLWQWAADEAPVRLAGGDPEFSPDGRGMLTVDGQAVHVWDAHTGTSAADLVGHEEPVTVARFSPDGRCLASGSEDGTVRIWDVATGATLVELRGHQDRITGVAFSHAQPDPLRLELATASRDGTARVWNPQIGRVLSGYPAWLRQAGFSADGTLVAGAGQDGVARVWRVDTGELLATISNGMQPLSSVALSRDSRHLVTNSDDGAVRVWDWRTATQLAELQTEPQADARGGAVAFDPSGKLVLVAGIDDDARIWDWEGGAPPRMLHGHADVVTDAAFSPDGARVVTASLDRTVRVWDVASGTVLHTLRGHTRPVSGVGFSADGRAIVTASQDRTVRIWDTQTGRQVGEPLPHDNDLRDAAFSHDGSYIVTGDVDGTVTVWDARAGRQLGLLPLHTGAVTSVRFAPDALTASRPSSPAPAGGPRYGILTAGEDGTARLYDCEICAPLDDLLRLAEDRMHGAG